MGATDNSQFGRVMEINFNSQNENLDFQESIPMPQNFGGNTSEFSINGHLL